MNELVLTYSDGLIIMGICLIIVIVYDVVMHTILIINTVEFYATAFGLRELNKFNKDKKNEY